ncbi:PE-PPE domain-containing protein [Mycobacterium sp.]|uniref:PE-PPE domain-containing protein n=1 Tax=Mycobacterium sp. TaxID=1785 RepID=UPI0025F7F3FD|nr:PE-PPE domain-containing protein [Mycobacterium sp.]
MRQLFAGVVALGVVGIAGSFGGGIAAADDTTYNVGGAKVPGVPWYDYTVRAGAHYFPAAKREVIDYPAGMMQGRLLHDVLPGLDTDSVGDSVAAGTDNLDAAIHRSPRNVIGLSEGALVADAEQGRLADDPSAPPPDQLSFGIFGSPVARHAFGQSFLTTMFPTGTFVPMIDYTIPPPRESQYDTKVVVAAYDGVADFPDRWDNPLAILNAIMGVAIVHTPAAFGNPDTLPPQNIRTTTNSKGATTTTYLVPAKHLPLILPLQYVGVPEDVLDRLDATLKPVVDAGYSRDDDPSTAPVEVDSKTGMDPNVLLGRPDKVTVGDIVSQIIDRLAPPR